jgi:antitoxin (DNA-binding transcriptional repressor) of toxin-antitoxin stability system
MTIRVDIDELADLAEFLAHVEAGEDFLLTRNGELVAAVSLSELTEKPADRPDRIPGVWAHLGPMEDPDIFFRPDPEFEELAESRDEDDFYRPERPAE